MNNKDKEIIINIIIEDIGLTRKWVEERVEEIKNKKSA